MQKLISNWMADLNGRNQNTYKFALQLALLENAHKDKICYDELAENFAKRYWNNVIPFKLRESSNIKLLPHFHQAIIKTSKEYELEGLFFSQATRKYPELIQTVIQNLGQSLASILQNPISRLQSAETKITKGSGSPLGSGWLYEWSTKDQVIRFKPEFKQKFVHNKSLLQKLTVFHWALFIEKYNQLPAVVNKLLDQKKSRTLKKDVREFIHAFAENKCFYCERNVGESFDIDHFIPFAFIFDNPIWDLVLSCTECNRGAEGKFEKLPRKDFLDKLINRNFKIYEEDSEFFEGFEDFADLKVHLKDTYQACTNSGFKLWKEPFAKSSQRMA